MTYTLNKYNGTKLTDLSDGSIDSSTTSIKLIGRNVISYGEAYNESSLWMMEHFANSTAPTNPIIGQGWFDTANQIFNVYTDTGWKKTQYINVSAPTVAQTGELWWDTSTTTLKVYTGSEWLEVGPIVGTNYAISYVTTTTNASTTTASASLTIPASKTIVYEAIVIAKDASDETSATTTVGGWKISGIINRTGTGTATHVDKFNIQTIGLATGVPTTQPWEVTTSVANNGLYFNVSGTNSSHTINWLVRVEMTRL